MAFTAKDVQTLREATGCGMMDCKKALTEADGDMEKATALLREKGLAAAAKKASRIAAEGLVTAFVDDSIKAGVVLEVNSETDFVAKNADFQEFVNQTAATVLAGNPADVDALLKLPLAGSSAGTVEEVLRDKILTIGENLAVRRFKKYDGNVVSYVHAGGKIGVLVRFDCDDAVFAKEEFKAAGKDIAMQIAALNPTYVKPEEVPAEDIEKEKQILIAQIKNDPKHAGKPENILEKMVAGKIGKFHENYTLTKQIFVKDNSVTVEKYLDNVAASLGGKATIAEFTRFEKGEGLEKRQDDFASEVAGMVK